MDDVGRVLKLRVAIDRSGDRKDWHLDYVRILNVRNGELYTFKYANWLSQTLGPQVSVADVPCTYQGAQLLQCTLQFLLHCIATAPLYSCDVLVLSTVIASYCN